MLDGVSLELRRNEMFADALQTQRVLHAAIESARHRAPVTV